MRTVRRERVVTILYLTFLDREPDPGGLDGWELALRTQLSNVIENGFVPSGEFRARIPDICGT
jgi:hypothetical protein